MEWVNLNPMILSTFGSLRVYEDESNSAENDRVEVLQDIYNKLCFEDRTTRPFRRAIGFTQVVKKDLLPLLICTKNDGATFDLSIKILMNLTIPVECLLPIDSLCKTDEGRNTIYELNWLLTSCKEAFLESKTTRCIIEHIKKFTDNETEAKVSAKICDCINNCLILLRNILHIPEVRGGVTTSHHNQILWNLFTHGFDKVLTQLISQHHRHKLWSISVVQLIALMYKDQHVNTLQKLLNLWFETSPSEEDSSEDNESNTSPPNPNMDSYSFTLTSDPNSNDSSDISGSEKDKDKEKEDEGASSNMSSPEHDNRRKIKPAGPTPLNADSCNQFPLSMAGDVGGSVSTDSQYVSGSEKKIGGMDQDDDMTSYGSSPERGGGNKTKKKTEDICETTTETMGGPNGEMGGKKILFARTDTSEDYGYGTQHHESISTSSNEDDGIPIHQKPLNLIQKARPISGKSHLTAQEKKEYRRKKLIKRSHTNTNMKALLHHTPSEDDIAHLLKEFTVDFLLKGYGRLVSQLYDLLVTDLHSQLDTSHFFWLITYFLKFVVQLELDIDHVSSVISFDILSYLSFEGINLCEHVQIVKLHKGNPEPYLRRLHLVVTSVKEILHTIQVYYSADKNTFLLNLQIKMCSSENFRCMMVLLIRQYDSSLSSLQYLQDLIVTNHMLLMLLETGSRDTSVQFDMVQHLNQFANNDVMNHYGVLLENFDNNGEFVNNSIFTMMHHVGGDLAQLSSLFQPHILKSFSKMWETDYDLRDDWSDLIEYTIHQYINIQKPQAALPQPASASNGALDCSEWSVDDSNNLYWYYVQNAKSSDPVGAVIKLYVQNGVLNKTRQGIVQQLLIQDVISDGQYKKMMIVENMIEQQTSNSPTTGSRAQSSSASTNRKELANTENDETGVLRDHLIKEKKAGYLLWLQRNLLEACAAKLFLEERIDVLIEPMPYHATRMGQSISLVPYSTEQAQAMLYQPFMLLLHKLGLHLPADAGKVYARIPSFLSADMLYAMAAKLGPINPADLKFEPSLVETKSPASCSHSSSVDFSDFRPGCSYRPENFKERINHSAEWIDIVAKTKNAATDDIADTISESTDSDLNRMYVSDEEFGSKTTSVLHKLIKHME